MNIIRKLKISEMVPVKFTEHEQGIIDLFNDNLSDLVVFIDESNSNKINYMKPNGTFIMQQDNYSDILWVKYKGFWGVLESKFDMEYTDIKNLIQAMVERAFKHKVSSPIIVYKHCISMVERAFKLKVSI